MSLLKEFQEFAMRGNIMDLAVGVIIGTAFAPIVGTLVDNIVMPPIGMVLAEIDFSKLQWTLSDNPDPAKVVAVRYGLFLNAIIKFMITAAAVFLLIKGLNTLNRPKPVAASTAPPPSEVYLKEIRDALVARK